MGSGKFLILARAPVWCCIEPLVFREANGNTQNCCDIHCKAHGKRGPAEFTGSGIAAA